MRKIALLLAGILLAGSIMTAADNSLTAAASVDDTEMQTMEAQDWRKDAARALSEEIEKDAVMAVVYMAEQYPLYSLPGQQGSKLTQLPSGTTVYIEDVVLDDSAENPQGFEAWYQVRVLLEEREYVGYVDREHLAIADEDFLQWETSFQTNPAVYETDRYSDSSRVTTYADVAQFPASYQTYLNKLKSTYPKWIFVPQIIQLDWNYVIQEEMKYGRSLVEISKGDYMYTHVHSPGWGFATKGAIQYYMDPRNGLTQDRIFQFEQLTFNGTYHTEEALKKFLNKTFMGNGAKMPKTVLTYSYGIWAIGANAVNTSPFHLAARIFQEQGQGKSPLISGTYPGYEGYYNFFNVKASGTTNEQIYVNGLTYARNAGWSNGYLSILGGAELLAAKYIGIGQDTLYLQKYDMIGELFTHQYMQNIAAPTSEGISTFKMYRDSNALDNTFVFKIPVYQNMPAAASVYPTPVPESTPTPEPTATPMPTVTPAPRPTPDAETASNVKAFVERMYTVALDRQADEAGVEYWTKELLNYEMDGAGIVKEFIVSTEFSNKKYNDREYISVLYKTLMGRDADESGFSYWEGRLGTGTAREAVLAEFVNSNEFYKICTDYSISKGYMRSDGSTIHPGIGMFAQRLYTKVFARAGEKDGIEFWTLQIADKVQTAEAAARGFFFSEEYRKKNTNDEEYIRTLYAAFMDREADTSGLDYWKDVMKGGKSREDVLNDFANSLEFKGIMASYGL